MGRYAAREGMATTADWYTLPPSPYGFDDPDDPFFLAPADRQRMVEIVAKRVKQWGLAAPATLLFALMKPASVLLGNTILLGSPFIDFVFGEGRREVWQNFWNDRRNIELLLQKIENDVEAQAQEKEARKAARRARKAASASQAGASAKP